MSDFMHCNTCYVQPSAQGMPAYFLTTCYHILCKGCLQKETGDPRLCPVCKHEMNAVEINSAMDPKLQNLFKPPKKLVEEKLTVLKRKYDFQQTLVNSLLGHLKQQRAKLEQMTKYCQEQAKYSKDKAKEMAELKQWVSTAETKMKSSEQEKACLLKEIEELRKLTKRFGREPSCESTIDKIFGGTEIDNSEASSDTSISRRVGFLMNTCKGNVTSPFLNAPSDMDTNSIMGSLSVPVASPQSTVNDSSVISEVTTPKMLGLPKRGVASSTGFLHGLRKTPTMVDVQNPYAEVFGGSSTIPRCTTQRTSSSKSSLLTGIRHPQQRYSTKSPSSSGYVTQGSIIPRANTPSAMSRTNF